METSDWILRWIPSTFRPYVVLFGGVLTMMSLAIVYSFANMLPYLVSYLHYRVDESITAGSMIWLQTLLSGVPFSMLIGGVVEQSMGGRMGATIGCALYTGSIAFSSIIIQDSYSWLLLTFGFLPSFGSGIAYNAVLITAQRWFPSRIGFASGVIVAGFGCGTLFIAPLQTLYVNPDHYTTNSEGYFTQEDLLDRVPSLFIVMALFFTVLQLIGLLLLASPIEDPFDGQVEDDTVSLLPDSSRTSIRMRDMFFSSSFLFIFLTLFFSSIWVQVTTGFYKSYGLQFISSDHFLSMVAAVSSIFNCGSRITWGWLADKTSYQKTMVSVSLLAAFITWTLPLVKYSNSPILFLCSICGIFTCVGGTYSLLPFVSSRLFGKEHFGIMYGLVQISLSLAGVISGLFGQYILPYLGFDRLFLIVGCLPIFSFILTSLIHLTPLVTMRTRTDSVVVST
ncbi:hypothetical protein PFISCL1PPCAC_6064 [Pristionchus fissidentatus]|uniref:Membrane transporter n=1 Tax=Pristionchus fissidentatus TaxID=1538716 RepID=A0AAV5V5A0_9BILA|nr:hypothetical protein PFISCL1PPCAC_6064 [Pristionchus fissidentatus]